MYLLIKLKNTCLQNQQHYSSTSNLLAHFRTSSLRWGVFPQPGSSVSRYYRNHHANPPEPLIDHTWDFRWVIDLAGATLGSLIICPVLQLRDAGPACPLGSPTWLRDAPDLLSWVRTKVFSLQLFAPPTTVRKPRGPNGMASRCRLGIPTSHLGEEVPLEGSPEMDWICGKNKP